MGLLNYISNFVEERRRLSEEKRRKNDELFEKLSKIPIAEWGSVYNFGLSSLLTSLDDGTHFCVSRTEHDDGPSYNISVDGVMVDVEHYYLDAATKIYNHVAASHHKIWLQDKAKKAAEENILRENLLDKLLES